MGAEFKGSPRQKRSRAVAVINRRKTKHSLGNVVCMGGSVSRRKFRAAKQAVAGIGECESYAWHKVLLVGNASTGKTSIRTRLSQGTYVAELRHVVPDTGRQGAESGDHGRGSVSRRASFKLNASDCAMHRVSPEYVCYDMQGRGMQ